MKTLVFPRPSGHNLIIEWDIFYPLPATWHIDKKKKPPAPPTTTPKEEIIETWDEHKHPGEIWVPPSGWSPDTNVINSLSDVKRRIWSESNVSWNLCNKLSHADAEQL